MRTTWTWPLLALALSVGSAQAQIADPEELQTDEAIEEPSVSKTLVDPTREYIFNDLRGQFGSFPKMEPSRLRSVNAGGYYRYFMDYRYLPGGFEAVAGYPLPERDIFIGDDSQLPQFMLNISGKAGKGATWGMDLFAFQFLEGNVASVYSLPVT
ncbi:MAG: hypothetical protein VW420_07670, partial [Schleiferiaceae bacterium]